MSDRNVRTEGNLSLHEDANGNVILENTANGTQLSLGAEVDVSGLTNFGDSVHNSIESNSVSTDVLRSDGVMSHEVNEIKSNSYLGEQLVPINAVGTASEDTFEVISGSASMDSTEQYRGMDSLKLSAGSGDAIVRNQLSSARTYHPEDNYFSIATKVDGPEGNAVGVTLNFIDGGFNYLTYQASLKAGRETDWVRHDFRFAQVGGSFDPTNITKIELQATNAGNVDALYLQDARVARNEQTRGAVVVSLDDCHAQDYEAWQRLADKAVPLTIAMTPGYIVDGSPNSDPRLTLSEATEMRDGGAEFVNHTWYHEATNTDTVDDVMESVKRAQKWMYQNGFHNGADLHIHTNGAWNVEYINRLSKYFKMSASVAPGVYPWRLSNPFVQGRETFDDVAEADITDDATNDDITRILNHAEQYNYVAHIYGHMNNNTLSKIDAIADEILARDLEPITMREYYRRAMSVGGRNRDTSGTEAGAVPVDATGTTSVTVSHGLSTAPRPEQVDAALSNPTQTDWSGHIDYIDNITATSFDVAVTVDSASATAGATADLSWSINR